jgi:hypothetical protein
MEPSGSHGGCNWTTLPCRADIRCIAVHCKKINFTGFDVILKKKINTRICQLVRNFKPIFITDIAVGQRTENNCTGLIWIRQAIGVVFNF